MASRTLNSKLAHSRKAILIVVCLCILLVVTWVAIAPRESIAVEFDWNQSEGFRSFTVVVPSQGPLYNFIVAVQAKPRVGRYFRTGGWRSVKGRLTLITLGSLLVVGIGQEGWKLIDPEVTPLMRAAEGGDMSSLEQLIANGADVNDQDQRGWTALTHAVKEGRYRETKTLLAAGADPNIRDRAGRTAFLYAAWTCRDEIGALLVLAGADPYVKDREGNSAQESMTCLPTTRTMLEQAGAK